ncbi:hypothetical protein Ahy_B08g091281 isoform B [Arachis hypogaea]|uniref:40S ribosomal protein n=1 Tax=Arachis hypogaea TaxID=3818 RepID=A0A444Y1Y1_ARAHY|nr:hypothetical protein Ahy_B08g091281 isoform B [Arachis hypogaea]
MSNNLYCLPKSGERCDFGVVVQLDFDNVVDVIGVGGDIVIEDKKKKKKERKNRERMGRVRTKTVKKSSRQVIERYYSRMTLDFHTNKKVLEEVALIPSKRLRNKIAGFSTHLMKRIQKGPVRGISLKLQEEERERRMDFVPDVSAIDTQHIEVDKETIDMLQSLGMSDIPGITQVDPVPVQQIPFGRPGAGFGGAQRRY